MTGCEGGWRQMKGGFVYILASASGVLYTGVTGSLDKRIVQHRFKTVEGFTKKYNVARLVFYERHPHIRAAIAREKQIKGWTRKKKISLIEASNPKWKDLAEHLGPTKPT
jgi:putative endonuclease